MVFNLSFLFSSALDAITAGTEQPKPSSNGIKALPESPILLIMSSITNATLDIYPLSSRKASARKSIKILGKKVKIPPTPEIIPSTTREISISLVCIRVRKFCAPDEIISIPTSKYAFSQSPMVKVRKNTKAMIPRKIGSPRYLCVKYLSIRSVNSDFASLLTSVSSIISSIKSYF